MEKKFILRMVYIKLPSFYEVADFFFLLKETCWHISNVTDHEASQQKAFSVYLHFYSVQVKRYGVAELHGFR